MPTLALVVYPRVAVLAAPNGLRLLAPVALLGDLASALDASLTKAASTLLEAARGEVRGAAKAFVRLLVPFVRRGLIEGVFGSDISSVPPSEALEDIIQRMSLWVDEAEAN